MSHTKRQQRLRRSLSLEPLEPRTLLAGDFTNPANPLDVNGDSHVSPIDAVVVLNKLNREGAGQLPPLVGARPDAFFDVNCNGQLEPNDLLRIVNFLNGGPAVGRVFITPPTMGVRGQPLPFTFATELLEEVEYGLDWDGNGTVDETIRGPGQGVTVEHSFSRTGAQSVRVTAQIRRTGSAFTASGGTEVVVDVLEMQGSDLVVGGTSGEDAIKFTEKRAGQVDVELNGISLGTFSVRGIVAYGQFGDDIIEAAELSLPVEFHGGPGDDLLRGGTGDDELMGEKGSDIIVGGLGSDRIEGNAGRDLLIGGQDADQIHGGTGDDILIAGPTALDDNTIALTEISSVWRLPAELAVRTESLSRSLNAAAVFNDAANDLLSGQTDVDLFFGDATEVLDLGSDELLRDEASFINTAVTTDASAQLAPSIAVNPLDPDHVVIAYMDYSLLDTGYAGIGVAVSQDAGTTWEYSSIPIPEPFNEGAADPRAAFNNEGAVFVAFQAATFLGPKPGTTNPDVFDPVDDVIPRIFGFQSNNGIFVARSDDGGMTWNAAATVASETYEGEKVLFHLDLSSFEVDTFGELPDGRPNPNHGNLYVAWTVLYPEGRFPGFPEFGGDGDLLIATSRDAGSTWETQLEERERWNDANGDGVRQEEEITRFLATVLHRFEVPSFEGATVNPLPRISIGPEGDVYVSKGVNDTLSHSTDGANSFEKPGDDFPLGDRVIFRGFDLEPFPLSGEFLVIPYRNIAADPTRPGHIYGATVFPSRGDNNNVVDAGDLYFARSTDYGQTWESFFEDGSTTPSILNDENGGEFATGESPTEVVASQAFVRVRVDDNGNIAILWVDQRRDPESKLVDVFATVSTDGGDTFSPNFRISDVSFDVEQGAFIDPRGRQNFLLGLDMVSFNFAAGKAYITWTDTRTGNKDVFFAQHRVDPPPKALNDRFEPNNAPQGATTLGVVAKSLFPKLEIQPGDEDWFLFEAGATGDLIINAPDETAESALQVELWNNDGTALLGSAATAFNPDGTIAGQRVVSPAKAGQEFLVRVFSERSEWARYSLDIRTVTEDLGRLVSAVRSPTIETGETLLYVVESAVAGSFQLQLNSGGAVEGTLLVDVLDADDLSVLAGAAVIPGEMRSVNLPVEKGQEFLVRVKGDTEASASMSLDFTILDQFLAADNTTFRFPAGPDPSRAALGDFNGDQIQDVVVSNRFANTISVMLGNSEGTFQAPRQFPVGPFFQRAVPWQGRWVTVDDFNADGHLDVVVPNGGSSDISVLLGLGDGTFEPHRRFNATAIPYSVDADDLNGDTISDLVVVNLEPTRGEMVTLLGLGDGTFGAPQVLLTTPTSAVDVQVADFNNDGHSDIVTGGELTVFLGDESGGFVPVTTPQFSAVTTSGFAVAELNGDGNLDLVFGFPERKIIHILLGNGDGTFTAMLEPSSMEPEFLVGLAPIWVTIADLGSEVTHPDFSTTLGPPDGHSDIIVANSGIEAGVARGGEPEVVVLPAQVDDNGALLGFGTPQQLAAGRRPEWVDADDLNKDGLLDVVVVDQDAVLVIYGQPPNLAPNDTPATARDLGTVVHHVELTQTIVPGHQDAYFKLTVPTEAANGAGDEVIDFSGLFEALSGAGLGMEVLDKDLNVLASGERFRIRAEQGAELLLHVFGKGSADVGEGEDGPRGSGAYTLAINVLPQVVSIEAQALLPGTSNEVPGGPTTSLVLTLQSDRLDPATAQDVSNYAVTHAGADNALGTADDQMIPVTEAVYSPSTNVDISSGLTFPTAVRQTVSLLFDGALPAGSYRVDLSSKIQTAPFNDQELDLLADGPGLNGHPVVSIVDGVITEGASIEAIDLVLASGNLGDFSAFRAGTPFLSQTHADLSAILDAKLTELGDDALVTPTLINNLVTRLTPAAGERGERPAALMALWLDPVGIDLQSSEGDLGYDLGTGNFFSNLRSCYAEVGGNFEIIICAVLDPLEAFQLSVSDVPETARGGVILISDDDESTQSLTDDLRAGVNAFDIRFGG